MKQLTNRVYKFIREYKQRKGIYPKAEIIQNEFQFDKPVLKNIYSELVDEGLMTQRHSKFILIEKKEIQEVIKDNLNSQIFMIRMITFIVSIVAICVSIYYTGIWFLEKLPAFLAWIMSIIMVLTSVSALQIKIVLWKKKQFLLIFFILIVWFVAISFSMFSTVAGQYNARAKTISVAQESIKIKNKKTNEYDLLKSQEETILKDIEQKRKSIDSMIKQLNNIDSEENAKVYNSTLWRKREQENDLTRMQGELKESRIKIQEYLTKEDSNIIFEEEKVLDTYSWIAKVLNGDKDLIEFIISIFPAVFIDIIAALCMAVGLFLKGEK